VKVSAPDLCGRFLGPHRAQRQHPAATTRSGWWIAWRAAASAASRPLVDISNYVMFELGRPSHIFDLDKIHGGLDVRWGKAGEQLKLLNGNTVTVDDKVGVIADDRQVESLAGIMGGDATAVSDDTATSMSRPPSGGPRRWRGARAASTSPPMPATASSAVWTRA
jgi:phenylalanyl-tRNA synthetase beta chain